MLRISLQILNQEAVMRGPDPVKVELWSKRLERFDESGRSVVEFCNGEGVSVASFYQWRRKLTRTANGGQRKRRRTGRQRSTPTAFQPIHVVRPDQQGGVTVRFSDGIAVELGRDLAIIENVLCQLLDRHGSGRQASTGVGGC
jgi:transposase-like protein